MKTKVLVAFHINTYFNELYRLVLLLQDSESYEPILLFPHNYPTLQRDINRCLDQKLVCLDHRGRPIMKNIPAAGSNTAQIGNLKATVKNILGRLGLMPLTEKILQLSDINNRNYHNLLFELLYLQHRITFARRLYRRYGIQLLFLGGDTAHYDTSCFIKAARQVGIASVIVPCTMSNAEEMAESYWPIKKYHLNSWQSRLFAKFWPRWVYQHKHRQLLRLPVNHALAMELLHLAPPHPWMNQSGYADVIATESEAMVEYYTRGGIPRSQLVVTGSLADDVLYQATQAADKERAKLCRQHFLDAHKPILLTALPPDQLYMEGGRPECDFKTYKELIEFWVMSLGQIKNYNVVVNLHPSVNYEDYKHLESFGVVISQENAASLIPLCDIFVACVSTIIRWAILCGIPVINYDVYRFRYHDYSSEPGVLLVETRSDFTTILQRLTSDRDYYRHVQDAQLRNSKKWGMLDGQVSRRMIQLFDRMTSSHRYGK